MLTASTFLYIVSGVGIVEHRLISNFTLGLLTKDRSYLIHSILIYPFALLLLIHVYIVIKPRVRKRS